MGSVAHIEEKRRELAKDVHRLARLGVRLMSISDGGVTVQNGAEYSLVVEVKKKQDSDPILLELNGAVHNQRVETRLQIFGVTGSIHGNHPRTVGGPTVRPAGPWFESANSPRTQPEIRPSVDLRSVGQVTDRVIMPPRRANARNANARNANAAPPVPDQEVSNVEFRNVIQMLVQSVANQNNQRGNLSGQVFPHKVERNKGPGIYELKAGLMTHAQQVESDKLREQAKETKGPFGHAI
ncbi:hypothetical protein MTR67_019529 [Solanum verrucosum]|uniref:Uncharacterized protein n=1 Tax=Solanum verrucosum TaxID=315347 RepID=A0AAF0QLP2_SOLVR|nr:hypothetical protein MTR67_019529 [Solanum verrucosum]